MRKLIRTNLFKKLVLKLKIKTKHSFIAKAINEYNQNSFLYFYYLILIFESKLDYENKK